MVAAGFATGDRACRSAENVRSSPGRTRESASASPRSWRALGADVVLNSFTDRAEDHALAERIADEHEVRAVYVQADMAKGDDCRALVADAAERDRPGRHPGQQRRHPARRAGPGLPAAKWDQILAINLSSAFHTTAAALPLMRAQGWGRIVNIASAHGLTASPFKSAYVAAKHGLVGLHQGGRARDRRGADHLQRHLPRLRADPARRGADPRHHEAVRHGPRAR